MTATESWTLRKVLAWMGDDFSKLGLPDARLDAELLVAHALELDRVHVYMDLDRPLSPDELATIRALVKRRRRHEPIAYILGRREFYGRSFEVNPKVLVPRPETELLVEKALACEPDPGAMALLDLCTGSGAIAISVALEKPDWSIVASDISEEALDVARLNGAKHGVQDRIEWVASDLFSNIHDRRFDVIVSNPPYIAARDWQGLAPDVTEHEPRLALLAGADGLDVIGRILKQARGHLKDHGRLFIEIGKGQDLALRALLEQQAELCFVAFHRDLAGIERVLELKVA